MVDDEARLFNFFLHDIALDTSIDDITKSLQSNYLEITLAQTFC